MLSIGNIIKYVRTLHNATLDGVKIAENEKKTNHDITEVNDKTVIKRISIIITTNLVIYTSFLIAIVFFCSKSKRWIDKIQA